MAKRIRRVNDGRINFTVPKKLPTPRKYCLTASDPSSPKVPPSLLELPI